MRRGPTAPGRLRAFRGSFAGCSWRADTTPSKMPRAEENGFGSRARFLDDGARSLAMCSMHGEFALQLPRGELAHRLTRCETLEENPIDRLVQRHLAGELRRQVVHALRGAHALGDLGHRGEHVVQLLSAAEPQANGAIAREVARAGEDEVAHPGETGAG